MSKFTVQIRRTSIDVAEVEVEAATESKAEQAAMAKAERNNPPLDWENEDTTFDIIQTDGEEEEEEDDEGQWDEDKDEEEEDEEDFDDDAA